MVAGRVLPVGRARQRTNRVQGQLPLTGNPASSATRCPGNNPRPLGTETMISPPWMRLTPANRLPQSARLQFV
ncbi:unnamed protein product [Macrosiphum euphorbiae]|uniref:Uncharacterized protein n=1 Tax=Macrosiphum euphorbiae TaxID=13131 RepID=A0AAV0XQ73_9HEMI|nr:unnamed protein product [Macrosiphum euphorbiae]